MDMNALFENLTISEIREKEKRNRLDIERKKEDLRVMVGERYRDLIEAADTIKDMKDSAENVTKSIGHMEELCNQISQNCKGKGMSCRSATKSDKPVTKKPDSDFYGIATQIKLLLDMPEKMWSSVDKRDYLSATQLYLLARHINTSLTLDSQRLVNILSWFPVLSRQWAAISHFKTTILQGCRDLLQDTSGMHSDQEIAEFLCSILLLEDSTPRQVFNEFLLARTKALQAVLHPNQQGNIKDQVCTVVRLLSATIHQIHAVFYNCEKNTQQNTGTCNLLADTLNKVTSKSKEGSLLDLHGTISAKCLPKSVRDFHPVLRGVGSTITSQHLQDNCQHWISTCAQDVKSGVGMLLSFVNSVKRLADIRDTVWELLAQDADLERWDMICDRVLTNRLHIWPDFLQVLFTDRVMALIQYQLDTTAEFTKRNISTVMMKLTSEVKDSTMRYEIDVSEYVWTETPGDIPQNSVWIPTAAKTLADGGGLMLKARAYTPVVQSLCRTIDDRLKTLLEDNEGYIQPPEKGDNPDMTNPFNRFGDAATILAFVQTSCGKCIQEVLNHLNEQLKLWQKSLTAIPDPITNIITKNKILLVARLCYAIPELVPRLQQCILGPTEWKKQEAMSKKTRNPSKSVACQEWIAIKTKLDHFKHQAFRVWVNQSAMEMIKDFSQCVQADKCQGVLASCTRWDEVEIKEEGDEGKTHSSKICVPMQASWYVQVMICGMCQDLNRVGGQALPRSVIHELVQQVTDGVLSVYQQLVKDAKTKKKSRRGGLLLTQHQALQHIFNFRFILQTIPRKDENETNKAYHKKAHTVCEALDQFVDPFDLDVFSPYIQSNLLKQVQRNSVIFGVVASLDKQALLLGGRGVPTGHQEQHNILPLTTCPNRFPLLPLSTQQNRLSITSAVLSQTMSRGLDVGSASLTQAVEAVLPKSSSQADLSSSLYDKLGSMGSSWFSKLQNK
ncbi:conserved oligomeric Golgi complex subunit 1-like [Gigantopelta aegis]|uniref:conserved oligomeric Golgi complex subunit 1-like n=1 Tax=Gigantopelta aegis TaxID=1735272 RepID=UPI001B88BF93|nr:conserved oligomeric Golgi complex subunit 1-like [Gigantopelta aegis]